MLYVVTLVLILPVLLLVFFVYIIYQRFDIFLMIKYKIYLELWRNDAEGECCQRKTPASDKANIFLRKPRKIVNIVIVYGIHCFNVFILSGCFFSLSAKKMDILTKNAPQSFTTWLYIFLTFITTLKCWIIWFISFMNGFKSVTFVACFVHLIKEITFNYIYTF